MEDVSKLKYQVVMLRNIIKELLPYISGANPAEVAWGYSEMLTRIEYALRTTEDA